MCMRTNVRRSEAEQKVDVRYAENKVNGKKMEKVYMYDYLSVMLNADRGIKGREGRRISDFGERGTLVWIVGSVAILQKGQRERAKRSKEVGISGWG